MTPRDGKGPRRLILRSFQSPGDVVVLTAAVRDLHAAHPGRFLTDVRTTAVELWEHNPHVTRISENEPDVISLDMQYPLIHQSNQRPYHFLHGYAQFLEERLGVRVPLTRFHGDIHLSAAERSTPPLGSEVSGTRPADHVLDRSSRLKARPCSGSLRHAFVCVTPRPTP